MEVVRDEPQLLGDVEHGPRNNADGDFAVLGVVVLHDGAEVEGERRGVAGAERHEGLLAPRERHAMVLEGDAAQRQQAAHLLGD